MVLITIPTFVLAVGATVLEVKLKLKIYTNCSWFLDPYNTSLQNNDSSEINTALQEL
jgi:hypothetical protein